jgi:hypothetical protein
MFSCRQDTPGKITTYAIQSVANIGVRRCGRMIGTAQPSILRAASRRLRYRRALRPRIRRQLSSLRHPMPRRALSPQCRRPCPSARGDHRTEEGIRLSAVGGAHLRYGKTRMRQIGSDTRCCEIRHREAGQASIRSFRARVGEDISRHLEPVCDKIPRSIHRQPGPLSSARPACFPMVQLHLGSILPCAAPTTIALSTARRDTISLHRRFCFGDTRKECLSR